VDLGHFGVVVVGRGLEQTPAESAPQLDERGQRKAGPGRVDTGVVAIDDAGVLHVPYPVGHRWWGQVHQAGQPVERDAAVALQFSEDAPVCLIQVTVHA
jgi:hypothetical protein